LMNGEFIVVCYGSYFLPFSFQLRVVAVGCHFVFGRMVGVIVDCGICCCRFSEDVNIYLGGVSNY
jgi:hypothetical protein